MHGEPTIIARAFGLALVAALCVTGLTAPPAAALDGLSPACPDPVTDSTQECWVVLTSADGMAIPALVVPPAPAARPTTLGIVYAHGAVRRSVGSAEADPLPGSKHWVYHRIADLGYWVIAPDYRGSSGHGSELEDALDFVGRDADDVEAAARFLREHMGVQRLVVLGSSGGAIIAGYGLIRHPTMADGFALVSGATDLYSVYPELSPEKQGMLTRSLGPYEAPHTEYFARSATHHVDQIARPVLIMHGSEDAAVSPVHDRAFAQALQAAGKPHEFHEYPGGHGFFWDPVTPFAEGHWVDFLGWVESILSTDTTITGGPPDPTALASATFEFWGTDAASFECRLDEAGFAPCTSPTVLGSLAEGAHRFEVRARTPGGIADPTPAAWSWSVLGSPTPDTFIDTAPPSSTTVTTATFAFHADVAGATFSCQLDGGGSVPCSSPVTYSGLALGGHAFEVRSTAGGVTDPTPAARSWTVVAPPTDTTPPDSSFTQTPASLSALPAVFAFTADEPVTYECRLKKSTLLPWTACTSPYTFTSLPPAAYTFQVRATDAAGNRELSPATYAWTVAAGGDLTPPDTTIASGPAGGPSSTATFTFTSSDQEASFRCRLKGLVWSPWEVCSSPHQLSGLSPRGYRFQVKAVDAAGNEDPTPAAWSWKVTVAASAGQR